MNASTHKIHNVITSSKSRVLVFAGGICLLAFVALLVYYLYVGDTFSFYAMEKQERMPSSSATIAFQIITMALIVVWGASVCYRCFDPKIRRYMIISFVLLFLWLFDVTFRYLLSDESIAVILWYLYYIPMLGVPCLLLLSGFQSAGITEYHSVRIIQAVIVVFNIALMIGVLTNNLHQLAFVFDYEQSNWMGDYSYGPLYWIVWVSIVVQFVAFFILLFYGSGKRMKGVLLPALFILAFMLVYCLAYTLRLFDFFTGNFSLNYVWLICVALELCFTFKLLPSFSSYSKVLEALPVDIKVYSIIDGGSLQQLTKSASAQDLGARGSACIAKCLESSDDDVTLSDDATVYTASKISGGVVLSSEDVSAIAKRKKELEEASKVLRRNYLLLEQEYTASRLLQEQQSEQLLYNDVRSCIEESLLKTKQLLSQVASEAAEDKESLASEQSRKRLMLAKIFVSYCKRQGGLALSKKGDPDFDNERFELIMGELITDLQIAQFDCAFINQVSSSISATAASLFYEYLYTFIEEVFYFEDPSLLIVCSEFSSDALQMRLVFESQDVNESVCSELSQTFEDKLAASTNQVSVEQEETSLTLTFLISKERV